MNIQPSKSMPDYIAQFINNNQPQLLDIYTEGINQYNEGMMVLYCSEKENKMDVVFMDTSMIYDKLMNKETYDEFKIQINNKQTLYVIDKDISATFIIYVN